MLMVTLRSQPPLPWTIQGFMVCGYRVGDVGSTGVGRGCSHGARIAWLSSTRQGRRPDALHASIVVRSVHPDRAGAAGLSPAKPLNAPNPAYMAPAPKRGSRGALTLPRLGIQRSHENRALHRLIQLLVTWLSAYSREGIDSAR